MSASEELLGLAQRLASESSGSDQVEAFVTHERSFHVKAYAGEVESLSSAEPRGAGVRVVGDRRVGFAYTTDLSDEGLASLLAEAHDNSSFGTPDDANGLPEPAEEPEELADLTDESQSSTAPEDKVGFVLELERATREHDPRIKAVEEAVYADSDSSVAIATSTGVSGVYRRTDAWCYAIAIARDGDETEVGFEFDLARGVGGLDARAVGARSAERALGVLGATKIPSARMPVVLDPYTAAQFLGVLGSALTAEAVQKGRSLFAGRLEQEVASRELTLVDDGRVPGAPGSAPWDAEGVSTQRTEVIGSGVLRSFLYDTRTARREERVSTGNAARAGFKSVPHPSPSNLAFADTGESREEVLRRADRALLVQDLHGVHSGANAVTGDFSVGATGRLLEGGEATQAVKEVTIAAPMLDILRGIVAVGSDLRWLPFDGSYGGATTLVEEMTVAGL